MAIPKMYTINEVCEMLHVSRWCIWHYERDGKLHPIRVGGGKRSRVLFTEAEIKAFLGLDDND